MVESNSKERKDWLAKGSIVQQCCLFVQSYRKSVVGSSVVVVVLLFVGC